MMCCTALQRDRDSKWSPEKLRLPALDVWGRHRAACPRSGRLRARAVGPERSVTRVCREAGATVRCHAKFRDIVYRTNGPLRCWPVGCPFTMEAQLTVDVTMRCALAAQGLVSPGATHINGAAALRARRDKELKYQELVACNRCALVVVAVETGGRWSCEAVDFVSSLAGAGHRDAPPLLRRSSYLAWRRVLWQGVCQFLGDLLLRHA